MADDQFRVPAHDALGSWTRQCLSASDLARLTSSAGGGAGELLDHVANCDYCAAQLKLLVEMRGTEPAADEQRVMQAMESSAPQSQARAVRQLKKAGAKPQWRKWAIAASVMIAVGSAVGWWRYSEDPVRKSSRLLAEAYTARRTFSWRLPDAGWTQGESQRGSSPQRPTPLLDAEALLARGGDRENDPIWLDLRARADILDFRFDDAIAQLQRAIQISPKSPDLLSDLAVAYGQSAESQDRPEQFAAAVEFSTRALALDPQNRRALFNRAIAFERLHMVDRAVEDWEHYLKIETDPAWKKEAQDRIEELRALQRKRSRLMELDEQSDAVLELKAVRWLKDDRPRARQAGKALLVNNGDSWLAEAAQEGVDSEPLLKVVNTSAASRADEALEMSEAGARLYAEHSAPAHAARVQLEVVNALGRSFRARDCRRLAKGIVRDAAARGYQWIRIQALLDQSSCSTTLGDLGASAEEKRAALGLARQYKIEGLEARALGMDTGLRTSAGDVWAAWRENRDMLARLAVSPYSMVRIQQCLSNYSASAESWGWRAASSLFMSAAADALGNTPNRITEAANRSRAAALALAAHLDREYGEEKRKADDLFAGLPLSETKLRYINSQRLLEGESYLLAGRPADAKRVLAQVVDAAIIQREQWRAHQLLGLGLLQTGDRPAAVQQLQNAAALLDHRVATLLKTHERAQARREGVEAYRALAAMLLDDDPSGARSLEVWLSAHGSNRAPDLVFLGLENGYALWTQRGTHLHRVVIDRSQVRRSISRLLAAAADPHRPVTEIHQEGRALFDWLVKPVLAEIPRERVITVLPDAEIAALPFDLLVDATGQWADQDFMVVFATGNRNGSMFSTPPHRALVVGSPATREALAPLPESRLEAEAVASHFSGSTVLAGLEATASGVTTGLTQADLFHYSGHGYAGAQVGGLYLADSLLTSESLAGVSLRSCRLAVLSACLTAVGETDGLTNPESLVHAFLDAGAHTVIASRWNVDSAATAELMSLFYADFRGMGDPAQSLRRASGRLRAEPNYRHPYYWAAFQSYE